MCVNPFLQELPESYTGQAAKRKCDITASEAMENHQKVLKRQKNLTQKVDFNDICTANSDDQLIGKPSKASDLIPPAVSDQSSSNITICGFCQSSRVSEVKVFAMFSASNIELFLCYQVLLKKLDLYLLGHWRNAALLQRKASAWR